ncbi:MAG TPA: hypothetical protein VF157_09295 [Chloroflexota bacterium]
MASAAVKLAFLAAALVLGALLPLGTASAQTLIPTATATRTSTPVPTSTATAAPTSTSTSTPTATATTDHIANVTGSGVYGGTATLSATRQNGGAGKTLNFFLNNASVGTAITDASGVATLAGVSLTGLAAGSYSAYVQAGISTDPAGGASTGASAGTLVIAKADQTISFAALHESRLA